MQQLKSNKQYFFELISRLDVSWQGEPECDGRDISNLITHIKPNIFDSNNELEVEWKIVFPYTAVFESGRTKVSYVTYESRKHEGFMRVYGIFSNAFKPTEKKPLYTTVKLIEVEECSSGQVVTLLLQNHLPSGNAHETHVFYFENEMPISRYRKTHYFIPKSKKHKFTVSLESNEFPKTKWFYSLKNWFVNLP